MAKEKRTKPCSNCKKSKVKCVYSGDLPCERCLNSAMADSCHFDQRLPSLKFDPNTQTTSSSFLGGHSLGGSNTYLDPSTHIAVPHPHIPATGSILTPGLRLSATASPHLSASHPTYSQERSSTSHVTLDLYSVLPRFSSRSLPPHNNLVPRGQLQLPAQDPTSTHDYEWKSHIENRIESFDNKLNDLVEILRYNQQAVLQGLQMSTHLDNSHAKRYDAKRTRLEISGGGDSGPERKQRKTCQSQESQYSAASKEEAKELVLFFNKNISGQLFGFDLSRLDFDTIWTTCPILVSAICAIASIHHPSLSGRSQSFRCELKRQCQEILFGSPHLISEAFNTVIALVLCSFWLSDSQSFTGLALQIAKEFGFNNPLSDNKENLKLWYLLYILDGQQSLTFNRQPLVEKNDFSIANCRSLLPGPRESSATDTSVFTGESNRDPFPKEYAANMRLVSQVEYNLALHEAFRGNAWDLLVPSAFGIPSKSNLELDKWMVSWTVLLATGSTSTVWSSKSTLIYYNFAKIHINSSSMRQLKASAGNSSCLASKWPAKCADSRCSTRNISPITEQRNTYDNDMPSKRIEHVESCNESDESDDEGAENDSDEMDASTDPNVAINAARTVLTLVVNDQDILDNLRYVPVHIHIMLYYAALLLVDESNSSRGSNDELCAEGLHTTIEDLGLVQTLQQKISANFPIDTVFGHRLMGHLKELIQEKAYLSRKIIEALPAPANAEKLNDLLQSTSVLRKSKDGNSTSKSKLYAWPGSNPGHP